MSGALPMAMIVAAAAFLLVVLYATWQSVRALLAQEGEHTVGRSVPAAERDALLREKEALLRAIRDARMDQETGKLSERDFESLNSRLRARAREVLGELEAQVAPHRAAARALLGEGMDEAGAGSASDGTGA